jgi:CheY-like chemotaxis protein
MFNRGVVIVRPTDATLVGTKMKLPRSWQSRELLALRNSFPVSRTSGVPRLMSKTAVMPMRASLAGLSESNGPRPSTERECHDAGRLTSCVTTWTMWARAEIIHLRPIWQCVRFRDPRRAFVDWYAPGIWPWGLVRRLLGKELEVNTSNEPLKRAIHILVVDDEPLLAQPLADALAAEGYEIEMAVNGQRALEKINDRAYDLILSDLRMPDLDGVGLYQELERRRPELLERMIFITGAIDHPDYQSFLAQTPVPVLAKPFSLSALHALTRQVLSISRPDVE